MMATALSTWSNLDRLEAWSLDQSRVLTSVNVFSRGL